MGSKKDGGASGSPSKLKQILGNKKVLGLLVFTLLAAGAGGFFFMTKKKTAEVHADGHGEKPSSEHADADSHDAHDSKHGREVANHDSAQEHADAHAEKPAAGHAAGHNEAVEEHKEEEHKDADTDHEVEHDPSEVTFGLKGNPVGWFGKVPDAMVSIQAKLEKLRAQERELKSKQLENANLKLKIESLRLSCHSEFSERKVKSIESALTRDTGSKIGRTLASISYKPPGNLFPEQLYTLAVTYFKQQDDERAAVLLTYLTNLEDTDKFKNPRDQLMAAVAWYRLDNFELSQDYLDRVLKTEETRENSKYHAHARLWQGLVSHRTGKHSDSQRWLRDLLDHHPASKEAGWVNSRYSHLAAAPTAADTERTPAAAHKPVEKQPKPHKEAVHDDHKAAHH